MRKKLLLKLRARGLRMALRGKMKSKMSDVWVGIVGGGCLWGRGNGVEWLG